MTGRGASRLPYHRDEAPPDRGLVPPEGPPPHVRELVEGEKRDLGVIAESLGEHRGSRMTAR